jgi:urea carboxylase-associated protein 2
MPTMPPSAYPDPPEGIAPGLLTWAETVAGGGYTAVYLGRGATVRLTDVEGSACAHVLVYNAAQPAERLNVADTIKVQWQAYPTTGSVLLSDLGRALATITADTSGRHDTLCGTTTKAGNTARYGDGAAQGPSPSGRELFVLAAAKHGLTARDLPPSLSFFDGVRVEADGALRYTGSAGGGRYLDLTADMPVLVLIANTVHPLDPREAFTCTPLRVLAWRGEHHEPARSPEMTRAALNTATYLAARSA